MGFWKTVGDYEKVWSLLSSDVFPPDRNIILFSKASKLAIYFLVKHSIMHAFLVYTSSINIENIGRKLLPW